MEEPMLKTSRLDSFRLIHIENIGDVEIVQSGLNCAVRCKKGAKFRQGFPETDFRIRIWLGRGVLKKQKMLADFFSSGQAGWIGKSCFFDFGEIGFTADFAIELEVSLCLDLFAKFFERDFAGFQT